MKLFACSLILVASISPSCRSMKYAALEKVGIEKRDLFKSNLKETHDAQKDAQQSVQTALEKIRALYGSTVSSAEKIYDEVSARYNDIERRATRLSERKESLDTVAKDLFKEWKSELRDYSSASLRSASEKKLKSTESSYERLRDELEQSEAQMKKVLSRFKEQVTFLKHNLNAEALQTLNKEKLSIEKDMAALVKEINEAAEQSRKLMQEDTSG